MALRNDRKLLGMIVAARREVRPFAAKETALLQSFAAQAVIAIENARLINETREALEQQTATAEVLQVINSSPGHLAPVFEAMLEKAMHVCRASFGGLWTFDADRYVVAALHNVPKAYADFLRTTTVVPGPGSAPYRFLHGERSVIQNIDLAAEEPYRAGDPQRRALVELGGARSALQVPLCKDDAVIGVVTIYRQEVRAFDERQIALLQSFAAQAVIAIQNARLLSELRESLEQQTATAEILTVISQSPTDVGPVLSAVARAAMKFCGANDALVALRDGNEWSIAAHEGPIETIIGTRRMLTRHTAPGRAMTDGKVVQIIDLQSDEGDEFPEGREIGARTGFRSALAAPLLRDGVSVGAISLRRREAGEFEQRQVELLKTFAAQAVIAIENVRLFTELKESLDQQTATAEVLRVISQSPSDVTPVLNAVAKAAMRFCGAEDATISLRDGTELTLAAHEGPIGSEEVGRRYPLDEATIRGRAVIDGRTLHLPDVAAPEGAQYGRTQELAKEMNFRAVLAAPMLRDDAAIGSIALRRVRAGRLHTAPNRTPGGLRRPGCYCYRERAAVH